MRNKFVSVLISLVILFLIVFAVYKSYTPNSRIQKTSEVGSETMAISNSLTERTRETAADGTVINSSVTTAASAATDSSTTTASDATSSGSSTTETTLPTTAATTTEIDKNLPTLKLIVYEGPVTVSGSDLCYYRVEARVTGTPAPFIKFSRDDSGGVWGKNIAQINLKSGESYDLVATATNSSGSVKRHIVLTWNPATPADSP